MPEASRRFPLIGRPSSLRGRMTLIIALALSPACALAAFQAISGFEDAEERRGALFDVKAFEAVDEERSAFIKIRQALRLAALRAAEELAATGGCAAAIASLSADHEWSTNARIFDRSGELSCGGEQKISLSARASWPRFVEDPVFAIAEVLEGRISKKPIMLAYQPMPTGDDRHFAIAVGIDMTYLRTLTEPSPGEPIFALLDRDGRLIAAAGETGEAAAAASGWLPEDPRTLLLFGDRGVDSTGADGSERHFFSSEISPGQLWAVTSRPDTPVGAVMLSREGAGVLAPFLICLIAVAVAGAASDRLVVTHIDRLRRAASRVADGEVITADPEHAAAPDEVRHLETALVSMSGELIRNNETLRENLDIQARLMLEIHHRVKNNLQTISSFMNLESRRFHDPAAKSAFRAIRDRVHSLSLVHRNLYTTTELDEVSLHDLIAEITSNLAGSLARRTAANGISMKLDPIIVGTVAATPIALFLTEAIGNAFKHGDGDDPEVSVELTRDGESFTLSVVNRISPSAPKVVDELAASDSGMGSKLMKGFANQISGTVERAERDGRFSIRLTAPLPGQADLFALRRAAAQ